MHRNVADAIEILKQLGLPTAQQGEQTALCLLAILNLQPNRKWKRVENPMMGITPIMEWIATFYGKKYAPNTRETIRKSSMHTFVKAGIVLENPDQPSRPVNSPNWVYQIEPTILEVLRSYRTRDWNLAIAAYLAENETLVHRYSKARKLLRIPVKITSDIDLTLTPGDHSTLIKSIIEDFGSQFVPDGELVYVGDTGSKWGFFNKELLSTLGVSVGEHGIMPDVVIYCRKRNWLILAEAVTSSGPVDSGRHESLKKLFLSCTAGLVFVTAFPDGKLFRKFITDIAWETEVWLADAPTHLIHFNGERFLGPYAA